MDLTTILALLVTILFILSVSLPLWLPTLKRFAKDVGEALERVDITKL